jgi:hypothetical protein
MGTRWRQTFKNEEQKTVQNNIPEQSAGRQSQGSNETLNSKIPASRSQWRDEGHRESPFKLVEFGTVDFRWSSIPVSRRLLISQVARPGVGGRQGRRTA